MLNNALQYLDDKRRRFQRADTAPDLHATVAAFRNNNAESTSATPTPKRRHRPSGSLQPSPEGNKYRKGSLENLLHQDRRSNSVDFGKRLRVSPKSLRNSPSVPSKLNRYTFVRRLTRYNSARSMDELKSEVGRSEKVIRDANDLFEAVETGDLASCREVLQRRPALLNTINDLQLTPLDVALLRSPPGITEYLIELGAQARFACDPARLQAHLANWSEEVSAQVLELSMSRDSERELGALEQTLDYLKRLRRSLDRKPIPGPPARVAVEAAGRDSLLLSISPPADAAVLTYRIEWSINAEFQPVIGQMEVPARNGPVRVTGLQPGMPLSVRVSAANCKGWGRPRIGHPRSVAPSTWRDSPGTVVGGPEGNTPVSGLRSKLEQVLAAWTVTVTRAKSPLTQRKRSLRNLFAPASRFVRHLRPGGLYLSLVCHAGEKVAVFEEALPCLAVEEDSGGCLRKELGWLSKLVAAPSDLRALSSQAERWTIPSSVSLRHRLLQAVAELQGALGTSEVGHVFPEVIRRGESSLLVLVRRLRETKAVALGAGLRWSTMGKLQKSGSGIDDVLNRKLDDFTNFSERALKPLSRGLHLCYVSLKSHMDHLEILVRNGAPGLLPGVRVRENPHVSQEEWDFVRSGLPALTELENGPSMPATQSLRRFVNALAMAWNSLQVQLNLGGRNVSTCQLYRDSVIELSEDVTLLLVFPSMSRLFAPLDTDLHLPSSSFSGVPLQIFDLYTSLAHRDTSGSPQTASFAATVELVQPLALQSQREAFTEREIESAKMRVACLAEVVAQVEAARSGHRWVADIVSRVREDKTGSCTVSLDELSRVLDDTGDGSSPGLLVPPAGPVRAPSPPQPQPPVKVVLTKDGDLEEVAPTSGTLRIHAGYRTGLAEGTSVRLFLTHKTTAREIVELVIRQLNRAAAMKSSNPPQYGPEEVPHFHLLVALDDAETPLPDDFRPLRLHAPWRDGKLVIRRRNPDNKDRSRSPNPEPRRDYEDEMLATNV